LFPCSQHNDHFRPAVRTFPCGGFQIQPRIFLLNHLQYFCNGISYPYKHAQNTLVVDRRHSCCKWKDNDKYTSDEFIQNVYHFRGCSSSLKVHCSILMRRLLQLSTCASSFSFSLSVCSYFSVIRLYRSSSDSTTDLCSAIWWLNYARNTL